MSEADELLREVLAAPISFTGMRTSPWRADGTPRVVVPYQARRIPIELVRRIHDHLKGPGGAMRCEWFALCDHEAVGHVIHPVLGPVPTCQRCVDKLDLSVYEVELLKRLDQGT